MCFTFIFYYFSIFFFVKKNENRKQNRKQEMKKKMRDPCDLALCALILISNFRFFFR